MATAPALQGQGIGTAVLNACVHEIKNRGARRLWCNGRTPALRFYQRLGFRMRSIERDAFTPATGYPTRLEIDGVELRDRVWLDRRVDVEPPP